MSKRTSDIHVIMILIKISESYKMYTQEYNNKSVTKEFHDEDENVNVGDIWSA